MTGYGKGSTSGQHYSVTAEMKSINSKGLEMSLRLPRNYFEQELYLKSQISAKLQRGKVSLTLSVTTHGVEDEDVSAPIDRDLLVAYHKELDEVRRHLGLQTEVPLSALLSLPGVISEVEKPVSADEWALVQQAVDQAMDALIKSRCAEGNALQKDFEHRINVLELLLADVTPLEAERMTTVKQRLNGNLSEMMPGRQVDADRFEQELIYYLEKNDITEEQVRLSTHLQLFRTTLREPESQGRKLSFVAQEMGREINTLGAKAYHAGIQSIVVRMKDELEKIKEQVMNIL
jgi:uncharacterized protein (TIGR00255 family)